MTRPKDENSVGNMNREKGKRFERKVSHLFRDHGFDAHRTAQYKGNTGQAGDIEGVPHLHIEAKHQERMNQYDWMEQSTHDATAEDKGNLPVVIHKGNHKPVLVTMLFKDWIQLYREYASGIYIKNQKHKTVSKKGEDRHDK